MKLEEEKLMLRGRLHRVSRQIWNLRKQIDMEVE